MISKYFSYLYLSGVLYWRIEKIKLFVAAEKKQSFTKERRERKRRLRDLPGVVMLFSGELIMIWCLMISYLSNTVLQSNAPQ